MRRRRLTSQTAEVLRLRAPRQKPEVGIPILAHVSYSYRISPHFFLLFLVYVKKDLICRL